MISRIINFYDSLTERCLKRTFGFWLFISLIFFDQLTKYLFVKFFSNIVFYNSRLIFNIASPKFVIIVLYVLVISFVLYFSFVSKRISPLLGILILAGGISNFFDRLVVGTVVDFIHIGSAVFNVADFYIIFALVFLLFRNNLSKLE